MKVKKFRGDSVDALLREIREQLGSDAHLLETRSVRKPGILGLLRPREVEIVVAYEVPPNQIPVKRSHARPHRAKGGRGLQGDATSVGTHRSSGSRDSTAPFETARSPGDEIHPDEAGREASQSAELPSPSLRHDPVPASSRPSGPPTGEVPGSVGTKVGDETQRLLRLGVPEHATGPILRHMGNGPPDPARLPWLRAAPIEPERAGDEGPLVVSLVGPTGSGKTTTCAKLAARFALGSGIPVGFITVDSFRVGAVEQLRTYSRILDVPLEVVIRASEAPRALRRLGDCKLVLVDTTGRAHHDCQALAEARKLLEALGVGQTHLVLGMNTDVADAQAVLAAYRALAYNRLLLTKIDETAQPGRSITLAESAGVPISYIATGQEVPEDLGRPDDVLVKLLFGGCQDA